MDLFSRLLTTIFFAAGLPLLAAAPDESSDSLSEIQRYLSVQAEQKAQLRGVQMDVEIQASIPKLQKRASLKALRVISKIGKVTYDALRFDGDNTVKKDVIARFLASEVQSSESPDPRLTIQPDNYKFKYKGRQTKEGRDVVVLELNPRRKEVGLFKGEVWLDPATFLPVREAGRFVKSPSIFLKRVEFVREFEVRNGVSVPVRLTSYADTRIVGRTELAISYSNFQSRAAHPHGEEAASLR